MRRGPTTASQLAAPMLSTLMAKKRKKPKLKPLVDPVEWDMTQVTQPEAMRRLAELRAEISKIPDK